MQLWGYTFIQSNWPKNLVKSDKLFKSSQRLNDEVIKSVDRNFERNRSSIWGPNGPNQHENLRLNTKISGKGLLTWFFTNFDVKCCISWDFSWIFLSEHDFCFLFCFENVSWPLPFRMKCKKTAKIKIQIIGPDFQPVSYFKKWLNFSLKAIVYLYTVVARLRRI